jgi:hypothetical protein
MQNEKDDRTKGQKRVTGKKTERKKQRRKKRNQEHKEEYTKASKEIIKHSKKTEKLNIYKCLR